MDKESNSEAPVEEDDIQLEIDTTPAEEPAIEDEMHSEESQPMIEVFDDVETAPEPVDETASGRLASLRQEMGGDDQNEREGSIEDRMKKFFGGNE